MTPEECAVVDRHHALVNGGSLNPYSTQGERSEWLAGWELRAPVMGSPFDNRAWRRGKYARHLSDRAARFTG